MLRVIGEFIRAQSRGAGSRGVADRGVVVRLTVVPWLAGLTVVTCVVRLTVVLGPHTLLRMACGEDKGGCKKSHAQELAVPNDRYAQRRARTSRQFLLHILFL